MRETNPWDSVSFDYPEQIPTMISEIERRYLFWLTSSLWSGSGHIVEMGPWLGGSTVCLAAGMSRNAKASDRWKIHTYDTFVWQEFMAQYKKLPIVVGESFESFFLDNLKPYSAHLCSHEAWLPDEEVEGDSMAAAIRSPVPPGKKTVAWENDEPIEILFVDGAKSWSGMRYMLDVFCPSLLPGKSLLVFQDYKYWGAYWVAAISEYFSDHLELTHILSQNTVTFTLTKPLTSADIDRLPSFEELTPDACISLLDRAAFRLEDHGDWKGSPIVRLGKTRAWIHKNDVQAAMAAFKESERRWPLKADDSNLSVCRRWLENETGRTFPKSNKTQARRVARYLFYRAHRVVARLRPAI